MAELICHEPCNQFYRVKFYPSNVLVQQAKKRGHGSLLRHSTIITLLLLNDMECSIKHSQKAVTGSNTASSAGQWCAEWLPPRSMSLQLSTYEGECHIATMTLSPTVAEMKVAMTGECPIPSSCCPTPALHCNPASAPQKSCQWNAYTEESIISFKEAM